MKGTAGCRKALGASRYSWIIVLSMMERSDEVGSLDASNLLAWGFQVSSFSNAYWRHD
jgi:hypothetical protein